MKNFARHSKEKKNVKVLADWLLNVPFKKEEGHDEIF